MPPRPADPGLEADIRRAIRDVPDFPKPGILFKDITPLLLDPKLFARTIEGLAAPFRGAGITHVLGIESRGFIFGAPLALALEAAFVPVRKAGKLPHDRERETYDLEYGTDALEVHRHALGNGARVLVVDDVIATGGTAAATCRLATRLGARIEGVTVVLDLSFLPWRAALHGAEVSSLVSF